MRVANIPTRLALIKRAEKLLKEIDGFFADADAFGISVAEADPTGEMMGWRKGIIAMLERERRIKQSDIEEKK